MNQQLDETEFDVIVLGTGVVEAIVAGAVSRIGKKVLHLDANDFYGSQYATFTLDKLDSWANDLMQESAQETAGEPQSQSNCDGVAVRLDNPFRILAKPVSIPESIVKQSRRYNIDLTFKLCLSRGEIINLLISSDVGKYLEFKPIQQSNIFFDKSWRKVPCTKKDFFQDKFLSLPEKRYLMKAIELCRGLDNKSEELESYKDVTFIDFLKKQNLPEKLINIVVHSIALESNNQNSANQARLISAKEGIERVNLYVNSMYRFNVESSMLLPLYGTSEIAQSFCRTCAVSGGIYVLHRYASNLLLSQMQNDNTDNAQKDEAPKLCEGIVCSVTGQRLHCKHLVSNLDYLYKIESNKDTEEERVYRYTLITDRNMFAGDASTSAPQVVSSVIPPRTFSNQENAIYITQLDYSCGVCPKDQYVVYFSTSLQTNDNTNVDPLTPCVEQFFDLSPQQQEKEQQDENTTASGSDSNGNNNLLKPLYYVYYVQKIRKHYEQIAHNIFAVPDPTANQEMSDIVVSARNLFQQIYPNEEFLPSMPDNFYESQPNLSDEASRILGIDTDQIFQQTQQSGQEENSVSEQQTSTASSQQGEQDGEQSASNHNDIHETPSTSDEGSNATANPNIGETE